MRIKLLTFLTGTAFLICMWSSLALAGEKLTGPQISALLTGQTVEGNAGEDMDFSKVYNADGTFAISFKNGSHGMEGTWLVKGDQYCQAMRDKERCYSIEKNETGYVVLGANGNIHTTFHMK